MRGSRIALDEVGVGDKALEERHIEKVALDRDLGRLYGSTSASFDVMLSLSAAKENWLSTASPALVSTNRHAARHQRAQRVLDRRVLPVLAVVALVAARQKHRLRVFEALEYRRVGRRGSIRSKTIVSTEFVLQ